VSTASSKEALHDVVQLAVGWAACGLQGTQQLQPAAPGLWPAARPPATADGAAMKPGPEGDVGGLLRGGSWSSLNQALLPATASAPP